MKKVAQSKYLGDNISADGRMLTTIETRSKKALGSISLIMTMLKELCLGKHYFKIAMTLRNLYFLNSVLCNSEVWYPLKKSDLQGIVAADKLLLRRITNSSSSVPSCLLFLELGAIPAAHIIKCRRILFLHYILTREKTEMIFNFFKAMERQPTSGD